MRAVRSLVLVFLAFVPALALAQLPDSVLVEVDDAEYPAWGADFGVRFPQPGTNLGPFPLTLAQGSGETGTPNQGCDPFVNADDVDGSTVLIERGACTFVQKVLNAVAAGAEAVVVFNDDRVSNDDQSLVLMGGDCPPSECSIPAAFISRASGVGILAEDPWNPAATITPIRVADPCFGDPYIFSTGLVSTFIFDDGFIGDYPGSNGCFWNFDFEGEEGLAIASVLVGQATESGVHVTGSPYVDASEYEPGIFEWVPPPFSSPFEDFDQALRTSFLSPLGVEIVETAYVRYGDAFVAFDLDVTNTADTNLTGVYVGIFADWDVGDAEQNLGGFDEDANLLYVYDASGTSSSYFGVAALGGDGVAGWTLATDEAASDPSLFEGLTTAAAPLSTPQDARTVLGIGPFDLAPGDTVNARFAMVAGTGEADIVANAQAAQEVVAVASEEAAQAAGATLSVYPNPLTSRATISFELPVTQYVRLAVYDVLGREMVVLADGVRTAGEQRVAFDATALPSGVYLVRLEAGSMRLVERVTVMR